MKKIGLLPRLALNGIRRNGSTYLPYIGISIFALFTYFSFDLILKNKIMTTLPRAAYAHMMMMIGFILLGIIMIPFLFYTNSFLIKRRKKELGLYSILGMEKKHIGILMLIETLIIYVIVIISAIALGLIFSKLIFLLLLNLTNLPVDATFMISGRAIIETCIFYAIISCFNLFVNLIQVGKANPTELMSESKKGEKEPKHILLWSILGLILLGYGYYLAVTSKVNADIFLKFFLAVFLVVQGTHFLFTSGSIALLRRLKKRKNFYYRPGNFIVVSGMIYRMKKNAASLVNICIFATMVLITMICTVSLYLGIPGIQKFMYPNDIQVSFQASDVNIEEWKSELEKLAQEENIQIEELHTYEYTRLSVVIKDDSKDILLNDEKSDYAEWYQMRIIPLDSYNDLEGTSYELNKDEVLLFTSGQDYGKDEMVFLNGTYQVKKELKESVLNPKANVDYFDAIYYVIVPDINTLEQIATAYGVNGVEEMKYLAGLNLKGGSQVQRQSFTERLRQICNNQAGFIEYLDFEGDKMETEVMYGGLLFIGIFFGIIFMMCLLIIMYYKQITEGFDDQQNFEIMQKVGMSDEEVKYTIKKQILQVFFIPLIGAIIHTIVGMFMVINLMAVLCFFDIKLIITGEVGICLAFALVYSICYKRTAKAYYRIVRRWGVS